MGSQIGSGGMAVVHLAVLEGPGGFEKFVVFKRTLGWAPDTQLADRFLTEARLAAQLNHPNIVDTLDVGTDKVSPYIVMQYLRGESVSYLLSTLQDVEYGIPVALATYVAAQVAAGLDYAHSLVTPDGQPSPILHRDVSPSNIMVCYNGAVKLLDFGIATRPGEGMTQSGILKGKVSHMAPEQLQGKPADERSDVFQLAIVLWEMLTRRRLFPGRSNVERMHQVVYRDIPPPSSLNDRVPAQLDRVVLGALARDPEQRCSSALEFQEQLENCMMTELPSAGGRELRSWMAKTFSERVEFWKNLEQQVTEGPSVEAEPPRTRPEPRAASWSVLYVAAVLLAVVAGGVSVSYVLSADRLPTMSAGLEPSEDRLAPFAALPPELPAPQPVVELVVEQPVELPEPPEEDAEPADDDGPASADAEIDAEPGADGDVEEAVEVELPGDETGTEPDAPVAPTEPDEPDEPDVEEDDGWRLSEQDEILDPFATGG